MKYLGATYFFLMFIASAAAAPMPTVKFTPTLKIFECPPVFKHKAECVFSEKKLDPVKLYLNIEVMNQEMGQWTYQETTPVPVSFYVIVMQGLAGSHYEYSVSAETGLVGSLMPLSNARAEFDDNSIPKIVSVSSQPFERDGKKYIAEMRLADFHGRTFTIKK